MTGDAGTPDYRFALCLSGGIALGSYMAGVLAQLYADMHAVNEWARQPDNGGRDRLYLDAIAGSSAGSITGLILAQAVASDLSPEAFTRKMEQVWIDTTEILTLLDPASSPAESLFTERVASDSANLLEAAGAAETAYDRRKVIGLWITITNLDGIPYCIDFAGKYPATTPDPFLALSYRDYMPFFIHGSEVRHVNIPIEDISPDRRAVRMPGAPTWWNACRPADWAEVKEAATVSGSFPLAFHSRPVERDLSLYQGYLDFKEFVQKRPETLPEGRSLPPGDRVTLQYVDGGIFNNQPIGRAIDAVSYLEQVDPGRADDERTYLVIEPDPNPPDQIAEVLTTASRDRNGLTPEKVAMRLVGAYFNDALYSDFAHAAETNDRIEALDAALAGTGLSDSEKHAIRKAIGYHYKRRIYLERIPARLPLTDRLAGDFAGHFGGFLEHGLRELDFATGRYEAARWFRQWLAPRAEAMGYDPGLLGEGPANPHVEQTPYAAMSWEMLTAERRSAILTEAARRVEALVGRWISPSRGYLPAIRALLAPKAREMFAAGPPASPAWRDAIGELMADSPLRPALCRARLRLEQLTYALVGLFILAGMGATGLIAAALQAPLWPWLAGGAVAGLLAGVMLVQWVYTSWILPYLPIDLPGTLPLDSQGDTGQTTKP